MFVIEFHKNSAVNFYNLRGQKEWYGSDYGRGTKLEVIDIISANRSHVYCLGIDGETVEVPLDAVNIISVTC